MAVSYLEDQFERMVLRYSLPIPYREYNFHRYRFDFAWPKLKVAVEIDGGTYIGGNHVKGKAYHRDCKKHNLAQLEGWVLLRADKDMSGTDEFLCQVRKMLLERVRCLMMKNQQQ